MQRGRPKPSPLKVMLASSEALYATQHTYSHDCTRPRSQLRPTGPGGLPRTGGSYAHLSVSGNRTESMNEGSASESRSTAAHSSPAFTARCQCNC